MTVLTSHLSAAGLEARYETAADPVSKSHFHAIWLLSSGHTVTEVAAILSFSGRWVRLLRKRYNEQGPDSLGDRRQGNGSAPAILTPEALSSLKERLKTPPNDGGLWTGPKVDEHRIGLKPILRGVWAPKGQRPTALGHHRYEWLYIWGFVEPATGATVWNVSNAVCNVRSSSASCGSAPLKELFEGILLDFAKSAGAGANKRIV